MRHTLVLVVALLFSVELALAQDAPKRKSGLWEITRTSTYTEDQPQHMRVCVDEASDSALRQLAEGMRGEACTTSKLSHEGDKLVVEATCKLRSSTSQTHAVISGRFDSAYTIDSKSTYKPALAGAASGHALLVAKWTGPCAAGQYPGETIFDNGATMGSDGVVGPPPAQKGHPSAPDKSKDGKGVPGLGSLLRQPLPGQPGAFVALARPPVNPPPPSPGQ